MNSADLLKDELKGLYHDVQTPLALLREFLRSIEKEPLTANNRDLLDAARVSLKKVEDLLERLPRLADR